ncbi:hypothetical protein L914_07572 [Phytophthora nicotianae]|uniref:Uncharacterized protein n=1 Tax=Phytophthora nicotianae TaxID=4792 RepID=W2NGV2_PHYNI|nr:hypothetical protein L914_07572 [Phytophthora nicotianae]
MSLLEWVATHAANVTVVHDLIDPVSSVASYGEDDRSIVAKSEFQPGAELVTLKSGAFLNGSFWLEHYDGDDKQMLQEKIYTLQLSGTSLPEATKAIFMATSSNSPRPFRCLSAGMKKP